METKRALRAKVESLQSSLDNCEATLQVQVVLTYNSDAEIYRLNDVVAKLHEIIGDDLDHIASLENDVDILCKTLDAALDLVAEHTKRPPLRQRAAEIWNSAHHWSARA